MRMANALSGPWEFQSMPNEMPIKMYRIVHTGPNNQFGGFQAGFTSWAYQFVISETVKRLPEKPKSTARMILIKIFGLRIK